MAENRVWECRWVGPPDQSETQTTLASTSRCIRCKYCTWRTLCVSSQLHRSTDSDMTTYEESVINWHMYLDERHHFYTALSPVLWVGQPGPEIHCSFIPGKLNWYKRSWISSPETWQPGLPSLPESKYSIRNEFVCPHLSLPLSPIWAWSPPMQELWQSRGSLRKSFNLWPNWRLG